MSEHASLLCPYGGGASPGAPSTPHPHAPHSCPPETSSPSTHLIHPLTPHCGDHCTIFFIHKAMLLSPSDFALGSVAYLSGFLEAPLCICPQVVLQISFKEWLFFLMCHGICSYNHYLLCGKKKKKTGLISGSKRSPGEGNGNTLQYSCLENPMDRGAWRVKVHGVAKSWT